MAGIMEFRTLILIFTVVTPWTANGLQIFSEGSTKPPQLFQSAAVQDPSAIDYGYTSFKKQYKKESGAYQQDSSSLKVVKKSAQNPFEFADQQSNAGVDFSQFQKKSQTNSDPTAELIKQYKKQQLLKKLANLEENPDFSEIPESQDFSTLKKYGQDKYQALKQNSQEDQLYSIYKAQQQQEEEQSQKFASSGVEDQKKAFFTAKQKYFASKPQNEEAFKIQKEYQPVQKDQKYLTTYDKQAKSQEEQLYSLYKAQQKAEPQQGQKFDSSASVDQKQAFFAAKQKYFESKPQQQESFKILKEYSPSAHNSKKFTSFGQADEQNQAFLLKWAKAVSESADQSGKMASQVNDAAKYYKVVSAFKVPQSHSHSYQFNQQPSFQFKQKSIFSGESDLLSLGSFGFGKQQQQQQYHQQPSVLKVVKIVKSPFVSDSSFNTQSTGFFNPFQKQQGGQKIIQKVKILQPIHYTNTLGFKTITPVNPIQVKPIAGFAVKKVIKPLIVY